MNLNDEERAGNELGKALGSGDPDVIARTVIENIWPLVTAHYDLLLQATSLLPRSVLDRHTVLRLIHPMTAVLARTSRPFKPLVYPDDARTLSPEEVDLLTIVQMIAFRTSGDVAASVLYTRRLSDRLHQGKAGSMDRADGPLWYYHFQIGSTYLAAGETSRALQELATCRQLSRLSLQRYGERMALGRMAVAHALRGSLRDAEQSLEMAVEGPEPTRAHVRGALTTEVTTRALLATERMADDLDERLAELPSYDTYELVWPFALLARSRALLATHQPEHALEAVRLATDSHPPQHGSVASDIIAAMATEACLALGDVNRARQIADGVRERGPFMRITAARLALSEGRFDEAAQRIAALAADHVSGPAQGTEAAYLAVWAEWAKTGTVTAEMASEVAFLAADGDSRRILATLPERLIARVSEQLSGDDADSFARAIRGLRHLQVQPRPVLTAGEARVLAALPHHRTTADIAAAFHVSPNTIKSQLKSLYRKLDCSTREDAIKTAYRLHLIQGD